MESFIYADLNKTCREKDETKIKYYGAFAAALSYIIDYANKNRQSKSKLKSRNLLYRGLKMTKEDADTYVVGDRINLTGYTSTSKRYECALEFALTNCFDP